MSGASGKVPAAIHLTPEAMVGGLISKIKTGDKLKLDAQNGTLTALNFDEITKREPLQVLEEKNNTTLGRSLFQNARKLVGSSEEGASFIL